MTNGQSRHEGSTENWPTYDLTYTFNPEDIEVPGRFEPDEVVIYDPAENGDDARWMSAKKNAYCPIEELR